VLSQRREVVRKLPCLADEGSAFVDNLNLRPGLQASQLDRRLALSSGQVLGEDVGVAVEAGRPGVTGRVVIGGGSGASPSVFPASLAFLATRLSWAFRMTLPTLAPASIQANRGLSGPAIRRNSDMARATAAGRPPACRAVTG